MNINILCPHCYKKLTDKFSAPSTSIGVDGPYFLEMECVKCKKEFRITISAQVSYPRMAGDKEGDRMKEEWVVINSKRGRAQIIIFCDSEEEAKKAAAERAEARGEAYSVYKLVAKCEMQTKLTWEA